MNRSGDSQRRFCGGSHRQFAEDRVQVAHAGPNRGTVGHRRAVRSKASNAAGTRRGNDQVFPRTNPLPFLGFPQLSLPSVRLDRKRGKPARPSFIPACRDSAGIADTGGPAGLPHPKRFKRDCTTPRWLAAQDNFRKWLSAAFGCSLCFPAGCARARQQSSLASRLPETTRLRFALLGDQRKVVASQLIPLQPSWHPWMASSRAPLILILNGQSFQLPGQAAV